MQPLLCAHAWQGCAIKHGDYYSTNTYVQRCAHQPHYCSDRVAQAHGGRRCEKLGIASKLKADDKDLVGKPLMKRIMQAWLPAHEVRCGVESGVRD